MSTPLRSKDIALIGLMSATLEAGKLALSFLPNIEIVTLLIILYSLYFGKRVFYAVAVFILLEGAMYGFGLWGVMYLYIWPILAAAALFFRKRADRWFWALLAGFYGLVFGALCSLPYIVLSGPKAAFYWWIAGIPYDVIHCVSNFFIVLFLLPPLLRVLRKLSL